MRITCPSCAAVYDVPPGAIGPNGRKIRCRACDTSWVEPAPVAGSGVAAPIDPPVPLAAPLRTPPPAADLPRIIIPPRQRSRGPLLLAGLVVAVVALGAIAALLTLGPRQVAAGLGLAPRRVPLGIAITRQPNWQMIAGGSQLFAVSGRIWNPTASEQAVPDIRAELRDAGGKTVYAWTIARPVARLQPHQAVGFDGAAVDVPPTSSNVSVSFAGTDAP